MSNGALDLRPEGSVDDFEFGGVGGDGSPRTEAEVCVAPVEGGLPGRLQRVVLTVEYRFDGGVRGRR